MQELLEWHRNSMRSYSETNKMIEALLEKEREQITDACWYGHDIKHEYFNPIHYFDINYQNK